jgi:hypothetical protein
MLKYAHDANALAMKNQIPIESACWRALACSEAPASYRASATSHRFSKDVWILAVVESELKLRKIEWQIFRAYVVIGAHHSTLQETPEVFDIVRVNFAANVLARFVIHGLMPVGLAQIAIAAAFIRSDQTDAIRDNISNEGAERVGGSIFDDLADQIAFTRNRADDGGFAGMGSAAAAIFLAHLPMSVSLLAADIGFVHFDDPHQLLEIWIVHRSAQTMAHIPSRLVGLASDLPLNLECADAFLGIEHLPEHFKPNLERVLCILENCSRRERESVGVALAASLIRAFPFPWQRDVVNRVGLPAARTPWATVRPAPKKQEVFASLIGRKGFHQLAERHHD